MASRNSAPAMNPPLSMTAIGRPLSRTPVIIRSHESSAIKYEGSGEGADKKCLRK